MLIALKKYGKGAGKAPATAVSYRRRGATFHMCFSNAHLPGVDEEHVEVDVGGEEDLVEGAARHRPRHRQPHDEGGIEGRSEGQRHRLRERESLEGNHGGPSCPLVKKITHSPY